jgi:hypothetical protein
MKTRQSNEHNDDLSPDDDRCDSINNTSCTHCGKRN